MQRLSYRYTLLVAAALGGCRNAEPPLSPQVGATTRRSMYEVIELGTLGGDKSAGVAVNDLGLIAGNSETAAGREHAFVWFNGTLTDLGALDGGSSPWGFSRARAINNRGQVAGIASNEASQWVAFLWEGGEMHSLGAMGGFVQHVGGLNDAGQVVGWADSLGRPTAFIADRVKGMLALAGGATWAGRINARGQVVGAAREDRGDFEVAFLWEGGVMRRLGRLPGDSVAEATAVSGRGHVLGTSWSTAGPARAWLWRGDSLEALGYFRAVEINDADQVLLEEATGDRIRALLWDAGRLRELASLGGPAGVRAVAMNGAGDVVGWGARPTGGPQALVWRRGRVTSLGQPLAVDSSKAVSINARGDVVGTAWYGDGSARAVLWRRVDDRSFASDDRE